MAMLQGKLTSGADAMTARTALEVATRGGAGCLGREGEIGELSVGAVADIAIWKLEGPAYAGVVDDLIEGWLRSGPNQAWHTIVNGKFVVENGGLVNDDLTSKLALHATIARRFQA